MFYKYLLINDEGNKVLYLYVDNNFEFGSMDYKKDKDNIYLKVKKYMERMGISFSGNKVCFVKNGIIIGMIDISDYDFSYNRLVEIIDANIIKNIPLLLFSILTSPLSKLYHRKRVLINP